MQHDTLPSVSTLPYVFPLYTVTEVARDQLLALVYTPYYLDTFKIYVIEETIKSLIIFNMHLRQKGFVETKQYVLPLIPYKTFLPLTSPIEG
ncbi:MAG: hypothetical protein EZS28_013129 [Streblomastix strix]|uniref:Uncharacterized protein n=1 Tax=Streblomastix strix TaxID=222440 RepID=A0A5J4W8U8_9EUKA|nr:MAG: hypothetical protein EZS28_013129 [Streblomastix strix]